MRRPTKSNNIAFRRGSIREFFGEDPFLKLCYPMLGTGTDVSGHGKHLTFTNAYFMPRAFGGGYDFRGSDQNGRAEVSSPGIGTGADWTITVWTIPTGSQTSYAGVFGVNDGNTPEFYVYRNTSQAFVLRSSGSNLITSPFTPNDNLYCITLRSDSVANKVTMYINGVPVGNATAVSITTKPFRLGCYTTTTYAYRGWIGETGAWDRALSDDEIVRYYQWSVDTDTKRSDVAGAFVGTILAPTGISSLGAFGTPNTSLPSFALHPSSIASIEGVGTPNMSYLISVLHPSSISSLEVFGTPETKLLLTKLITTGIASQEAFGDANMVNWLTITTPTGIVSSEVIGIPNLLNIDRLGISSIVSQEEVGTPNSLLISHLRPSSITSQEALGTPGIWKIIQGDIDNPLITYGIVSEGTTGLLGSLESAAFLMYGLESSGLTGIAGSFENANIELWLASENVFTEENLSAVVSCLLTGANTEYTSFPFNSFCVYNGKVYAAGPTGLFLLGGDKDVATNISATLETTPDDFGITNLKSIAEVVVGMKDGPAEFSHKFNNAYTISQGVPKANEFKSQRTQPGKGVMQRYWTTKITNKAGSPLHIDIIEFNLAPKKRKINQ